MSSSADEGLLLQNSGTADADTDNSRLLPDSYSDVDKSQTELVHHVERTMKYAHDPQKALNSGVAQIANIGSVISSTFNAFNEKFLRVEDLMEKSSARTSDINGEFRSQKHKIGYLKQAVDDIQMQMKEMFAALKTIEARVNSQSDALSQAKSTGTADSTANVEAKKRSDFPAMQPIAQHQSSAVRHERDGLFGRVLELERGMLLMKMPLNPPKSTTTGTNITAPAAIPVPIPIIEDATAGGRESEQHLSVISGNENREEHESAMKIPRSTILNLNVASTVEDKVIGIQRLSIKLHNIDFSNDEELAAHSELLSSSWEPLFDNSLDTSDFPEEIFVDKIYAGDAASLTQISATIAIDSMSGQSLPVAPTPVAPVSVIYSASNGESSAESEGMTIELQALRDRISDLESNAAVNSGHYLAQIRDLSERLFDVQEGAQSAQSSSNAIKRLQLALNDVIAEVDEMKYKEASYADDLVSHGQKPGGIQSGSHDHVGTAGLLLEIQISAVKTKLLNLRDDLDNGLDTYADAHAGDPEGSEAFESPFIARIAEFADRLDSVILSFHPKESPEATLAALFHPLDALTIELEVLFELDQMSVASMGITFDDVTAEGSGRNVRDTMRHVWEASLPLLDHRVNKITMRRRLAAIESIISSKADIASVSSMEVELRRLVTSKADQKELLSITSKKVSLGELQRLKDQLMKQIVSIRGFEYNPSGSTATLPLDDKEREMIRDVSTPGVGGGGGGGGWVSSSAAVEMTGEIKQLRRRFDILHSFHEDLAAQISAHVPREEVEQALRALLGEMRIMKGNSVSPDALEESLKTKANAIEMQKLVAALTSALGDIAGKHDSASAIHARCLICDKPVKSLALAPITSAKGPRAMSPDRLSASQRSARGSHHDKNMNMSGNNAAIGSGSMGLAAWGSLTQSLPVSPTHSSLNLMPATLANANTNTAVAVASSHSAPRTSSAPDGTTNTTSAPNLQFKNTSRVADLTLSIGSSSADLPPLPTSNSQPPSGRGKNVIHKQAWQSRMRAQGIGGGVGVGPIQS